MSDKPVRMRLGRKSHSVNSLSVTSLTKDKSSHFVKRGVCVKHRVSVSVQLVLPARQVRRVTHLRAPITSKQALVLPLGHILLSIRPRNGSPLKAGRETELRKVLF